MKRIIVASDQPSLGDDDSSMNEEAVRRFLSGESNDIERKLERREKRFSETREELFFE